MAYTSLDLIAKGKRLDFNPNGVVTTTIEVDKGMVNALLIDIQCKSFEVKAMLYHEEAVLVMDTTIKYICGLPTSAGLEKFHILASTGKQIPAPLALEISKEIYKLVATIEKQKVVV